MIKMTLVDKAVRFVLIMEAVRFTEYIDEVTEGTKGGYRCLDQYRALLAAHDRLTAVVRSKERQFLVGSKRSGVVAVETEAPTAEASQSKPASAEE